MCNLKNFSDSFINYETVNPKNDDEFIKPIEFSNYRKVPSAGQLLEK